MTPDTVPAGPEPPTRSSPYYLEPIIFQVENNLFKVPRDHFISNSSVFRDMFAIPQGENMVCDGLSDETPVKLDGITKFDFESLLLVMFPLKPSSPSKMTMHQWLSILKLSKMWYFRDMFALAESKLTDMAIGPVERVGLARKYNISKWLKSASTDLVTRETPLSLKESQSIGLPSTISIFHLREAHIKCSKNINGKRPFFPSVDVEGAFDKELGAMDSAYREFMTEGHSVPSKPFQRCV